ncbi:nicotinamide riboside transporter PnuC [Streptomyces sp. TRM76323]|uniref:Nicotinamide riboside transporter PnuC n=1 Tax=Streptomyces tamarix TaxID=3078565 RepID=A0ABU3QKS9_9ACTN|nr:nicotinamide riboside transporter PnuC [Streptomyces tamarix]MDT9683334.1 nicotinamide riboside transporter PnuC [Streptomyces tamarix]
MLGNEFIEDFKASFSPKQQLKDFKSLTKGQSWLLVIMLLAQFWAFIAGKDFSGTGWLGIVTGVATVINLVLIDRGFITNYAWGFVSAGAWFAVSLHNWLLSDIATQGFFFFMQFVGIYMWGAQIRKAQSNAVEAKKLTAKQAALVTLGSLLLYLVLVYVTTHFHGNQALLDASLLPLNIIGQMLMSYGYRTQWIAWIAVDVIAIIIWYNQTKTLSPASLSMLVLNITMLVNALYGAYLWNRKEGLGNVTNSEHN